MLIEGPCWHFNPNWLTIPVCLPAKIFHKYETMAGLPISLFENGNSRAHDRRRMCKPAKDVHTFGVLNESLIPGTKNHAYTWCKYGKSHKVQQLWVCIYNLVVQNWLNHESPPLLKTCHVCLHAGANQNPALSSLYLFWLPQYLSGKIHPFGGSGFDSHMCLTTPIVTY